MGDSATVTLHYRAAAKRGPAPTVLAVSCSDGTFRAPLAEFLSAQYAGESIDEVKLPGGPWWVSALEGAAQHAVAKLMFGTMKPIERALGFLLKHHPIRRVVLIGHRQCAWYQKFHPHFGDEEALQRQSEDLWSVRNALVRLNPNLRVDIYLATADQERHVTFHHITTEETG